MRKYADVRRVIIGVFDRLKVREFSQEKEDLVGEITGEMPGDCPDGLFTSGLWVICPTVVLPGI